MPRYSTYSRGNQRSGALAKILSPFVGGVKQLGPGVEMEALIGKGPEGGEAGTNVAASMPRYAAKNKFFDQLLYGGQNSAQAQQMNFAVDQMLRQSALEKALKKELETDRFVNEKELKGFDLDRAKFVAGEEAKRQDAKFASERSNAVLTNVAEIFKAKGIPFNEEDMPRLVQILQNPAVMAALAKNRQDTATADAETDRQLNVVPEINTLAGMNAQADISEFGQNRDMAKALKQAELEQKQIDAKTAGIVMGPGFAGNKLTGDYQNFMTPYQLQQSVNAQPSADFNRAMYEKFGTNTTPTQINPNRTYKIPGAPQPSGTLTPSYQPTPQLPPPPSLWTPPTLPNEEIIDINGRKYRRRIP